MLSFENKMKNKEKSPIRNKEFGLLNQAFFLPLDLFSCKLMTQSLTFSGATMVAAVENTVMIKILNHMSMVKVAKYSKMETPAGTKEDKGEVFITKAKHLLFCRVQ